MPKVTNPSRSGLSLNSRLRRLRFSVGFPLWFDFASGQLALDSTPTRDPSLKPLTAVEIDPDAGVMTFSVNDARPRYELQVSEQVDRTLLRGLHALHQHGCVFPEAPQDSVEFEFTGGLADSMILRRTAPDAEGETLRVFREDGVVYRLVPVDVVRTRVRALTAVNGVVSCLSELNLYEFGLRLPPVLRELTEGLVNISWGGITDQR